MKKKLSLLLVMALLLMGVFSVVRAQEDEVFKVAVVAPSAINDLAFTQSMYDALVAIQEAVGEDIFQFDFQESTFVVDDAAVALRDWAASGEYRLIIAHGSQYGSIIEELAPEFPEVSFAWGTDENTFGLDNVFAYTVAADQGGYVNGVVAAGFSRSKIIGVIGPIEVGDAKLYVDGFTKGAQDTGQGVEVLVNYIGSFSDVTLATEAAKAHVANGADVLTGTAQMVVGPIAVAQEEGAFWLGTQSSQAELAANAGLTFQIYHWEVVLAEIITKIDEGTLGGESFVLTLENGGLEIQISEFNEAFTEETVEALQTNLEPLIEGIIAGDVQTKPDEEATPEPEATEES